MGNKVLVIGLDGATFDLITPWVKQGRLPNLAGLLEAGSYGELRSTPNKVSPAAWTSFATGKNPGKHGIYHFYSMDPGTLKARMINASHRNAEPVWSYLSRMGKKVGVLNVPATFPVDEVNGFMIAGWDAPSIKSRGLTHPPDLIKEILKKFKDYPLTSPIRKYKMNQRPDLAVKELHRVLDFRAAVTDYLMKRSEWDLLVTVFTATDQVQHHFWHYMDDEHPWFEPTEAKKYGNAVQAIYERCDQIIGELLNGMDEDTTVIIMSDHGGTANSMGNLYLSPWLEQLGLAKKKAGASSKNSAPGRVAQQALGGFKRKIYEQLSRKLNYKYKRYIKRLMGQHMGFEASARQKFSSYDWSQTKAYPAGSNLRINLKGREPHGIVSPGKEYEDLQDFLIQKLCESTDIKTGKKIVKGVFKREDVYQGKHVEETFDLIVNWTEGIVISGISCTDKDGQTIKIPQEHFPRSAWSGEHADDGIFIAKGPHIKRGRKISGANIMDIAPSIIHLMGFPVPEDMDGKVLRDIFSEDFQQSNPIKYSKVENDDINSVRSDYSDEEAKQVEERLKSLGYL